MAKLQLIIATNNEIPYTTGNKDVDVALGYGNKLSEGIIRLDPKPSDLEKGAADKRRLPWDENFEGLVTEESVFKYARSRFRAAVKAGSDFSIGISSPAYLTPGLSNILATRLALSQGLEEVEVFIQSGSEYKKVEPDKERKISLKDPVSVIRIALDRETAKDPKDPSAKAEKHLSKVGFHSAVDLLGDCEIISKETAEQYGKEGIDCITYMAGPIPREYSRAEYMEKTAAGEELVQYKKNGIAVKDTYINKSEQNTAYLALKKDVIDVLRNRKSMGSAAYAGTNVRVRMIADTILATDRSALAYAGFPECLKDYGKHDAYEMTAADGKKKIISDVSYEKLPAEEKEKCVKKPPMVYPSDFILRSNSQEKEKAAPKKEPKAGNVMEQSSANTAPENLDHDRDVDGLGYLEPSGREGK